MEYVYAAMVLHKAGKKIDEASLGKVLEAAGVKPDLTKMKALVAALDGVDVEKVIKEAAIQQVAVAAAPAAGAAKAEAKPEAKKEDEKKAAEEAAAGLSALFG
ncbi:50S ribosomal protein P1 [Candidatus Woesearchaeota archaeon]|nr:50S ribosomal protein P1 [Candidatus Woesearchaeota archaeon]